MKRHPILLLCLLAAAALGLWWWVARPAPPQPAPQVAPEPAASQAASAASAPASAPALPSPVDAPLTLEKIPSELDALLGAKTVAQYLQLSDFPRRVVATVDNLGRAYAPPSLWPVVPAPDRFLVEEGAGGTVIAPDNASRYTPLVLLAETVDVGKAADLYLAMYPLLQQAYRQLGFPDSQFHLRMMAVIGQLLAAPELDGPPQLELTEVKGPVPSERPWVRYRFADPALEGLPAGQKIMVRVGVVNERRLKKKLAEFRDEVAKRVRTR